MELHLLVIIQLTTLALLNYILLTKAIVRIIPTMEVQITLMHLQIFLIIRTASTIIPKAFEIPLNLKSLSNNTLERKQMLSLVTTISTLGTTTHLILLALSNKSQKGAKRWSKGCSMKGRIQQWLKNIRNTINMVINLLLLMGIFRIKIHSYHQAKCHNQVSLIVMSDKLK